MSGMIFDERFSGIEIEDVDPGVCTKVRLLNVLEAGIDPSTYVSLSQVQEHFGKITRSRVNKSIRDLGFVPLGELPNLDENGQRKRGVAKIVYDISVIGELEELTTATINVEEIRRKAASILEVG